jgi:hypothetical protein
MSDPATCSDSPSALSTSTSITGRALNLVSSAFVSRMSTARLIASRTSFAGSAPVHSRQRGSAQLQPFMYSGAVAASWSLTAPDSRGGPVQPIPPDCPVHWVGVPLCGTMGLPILSTYRAPPPCPDLHGRPEYVLCPDVEPVPLFDGAELEINAGDIVSIPAGHDGWTV